ncbi:MAG: DUF5654 family protein [Patescibacteria group bacterium]
MSENFGQNIKSSIKETNKQVISQTMGFISSAFVLVAALAWNEAIKNLISRYFQAGTGIASLFIYAIVVTLLAVMITARLNRLSEKYKNENEDNK